MSWNSILEQVPYTTPFIFVDELLSVTKEGVTGIYTFKEDEYFYRGHFKNNPITPGVILVECMAQIGLVCLGIYLLEETNLEHKQVAFSSQQIDFYKPVFPKETVRVISEKVYFRFQKLKCDVRMLNEAGELVAKGTLSGMIGAVRNI